MEIRSQLTTVESKKVVIETDYKSRYEGALKDKLQELRDDYDFEGKRFKEETQLLYSSKVLSTCTVVVCTLLLLSSKEVVVLRNCLVLLLLFYSTKNLELRETKMQIT